MGTAEPLVCLLRLQGCGFVGLGLGAWRFEFGCVCVGLEVEALWLSAGGLGRFSMPAQNFLLVSACIWMEGLGYCDSRFQVSGCWTLMCLVARGIPM